MAELRVLLQRIQKPEPKPIMEPVPTSPELSKLLNRVNNQKWKEAELLATLSILQTLQADIQLIDHVRTCKLCQAELQISVERYWGTRGPWWINLEGEIGFPEIYEEEGIYKTCPKPQNYEIGCYSHSSEDTMRFIMDRMAWAEKIIKADAEILVDYYGALEEWDLETQVPVAETALIF